VASPGHDHNDLGGRRRMAGPLLKRSETRLHGPGTTPDRTAWAPWQTTACQCRQPSAQRQKASKRDGDRTIGTGIPGCSLDYFQARVDLPAQLRAGRIVGDERAAHRASSRSIASQQAPAISAGQPYPLVFRPVLLWDPDGSGSRRRKERSAGALGTPDQPLSVRLDHLADRPAAGLSRRAAAAQILDVIGTVGQRVHHRGA
jgi:hypothetical protein